MGKSIGESLEQAMNGRKILTSDNVEIIKEQHLEGLGDSIVAPIIAQGDPIGSVVICAKDEGTKLGDVEAKLAETAANFLAKQMEQ